MTHAQDKVQRMLAEKETFAQWPDVPIPKCASMLTSNQVGAGYSALLGKYQQSTGSCPACQTLGRVPIVVQALLPREWC